MQWVCRNRHSDWPQSLRTSDAVPAPMNGLAFSCLLRLHSARIVVSTQAVPQLSAAPPVYPSNSSTGQEATHSDANIYAGVSGGQGRQARPILAHLAAPALPCTFRPRTATSETHTPHTIHILSPQRAPPHPNLRMPAASVRWFQALAREARRRPR